MDAVANHDVGGDDSCCTINVAVWQGEVKAGDLQANLTVALRKIREAAASGVELLLFPELFLSGYDCTKTQLLEGGAAVELESSVELSKVAAAARESKIAVALPYAERDGGNLHNSCVVFDSCGRVVLNYRKVNLWGPWEQSVFTRGDPDRLKATQLSFPSGKSISIGVCICYDIEFPEPARCLAVQGAQVLLVPTALGAGDVDASTPFRTVPTRAMENHVFVAYANLEGRAQGDPEQNVSSFCGRSAIVAPDGEDIVRAGIETGGQLLSAVLRLDKYQHSIDRNPYLEDRANRIREGHYQCLTSPPSQDRSQPPAAAAAADAAAITSAKSFTAEAEEARVRAFVEGLPFTEHRYGDAHESQRIDVYLPEERRLAVPDSSGRLRLPVVFLIHGGFWKDKWHAYNTQSTSLVPDFLGRGFAVALIEYRRRDTEGGGFPGTEDDCFEALQHLGRVIAASEPIDVTRVVVLGHSAGGQLALAVTSRAAAAAAAGAAAMVPCLCVAIAAPPDMLPAHEAQLSDEKDAVERYLRCLPEASEDAKEAYRSASISSRIDPLLRIPIVLVTGSRDIDVPPHLTQKFHEGWEAAAAAASGSLPAADLLEVRGADHYQLVTAGHQAWAAVMRRICRVLQSRCGWVLPPHPGDYRVTEERGFLPLEDPLDSLLSSSSRASPGRPLQQLDPETEGLFAAWEACARRLPSMLSAGAVRSSLAELPSAAVGNHQMAWEATLEEDEAMAERAMLVLSFLAHAWVWGEKPAAHSVPENIARPWTVVARIVGRPPILTYFSYNLCNWSRLDPRGPIALGNTCRALNFLGGQDEEWFSAVHVAIEAKAGRALLGVVRAQRSAAAALHHLAPGAEEYDILQLTDMAQHLEATSAAVRDMLDILKRMKERCDPYIYYMRVRIFMSGWTHEEIPSDGMEYQGVPAAQQHDAATSSSSSSCRWRKERYFGETGAQSSVLPALDAALGVEMSEDALTPYLIAMRDYMPQHHAEFLAALSNGPSIRSVAASAGGCGDDESGDRDDDGAVGRRLVEAYDGCLRAMAAFRGAHLELAYSFVRKFDERKDDEIRGTGGTPFMPYLRKHWRGTSELVINPSAPADEEESEEGLQ